MYFTETFTPTEQQVLGRYFTNLDRPVFGLVNMPEVVKGALFARYSRSPKSLRRLFLDEFLDDVGEATASDSSDDSANGRNVPSRAERLYDKVFVEYGDDSVAQLGGVHLACEQASNILTKTLEWGRLASYLEQSTRYIAYDDQIGGRYRYYRDPELAASSLGQRYQNDMDHIFGEYAALVPVLLDHVRATTPKVDGDSDFVYRNATKAKALDAVRGMLPAAATSNVGIYGSGQAYEQLLLRMNADPLPEARAYSQMMLEELRKIIPSFVRRVDMADRGGAISNYYDTNRQGMSQLASELLSDAGPTSDSTGAGVTLVDFDPRAEEKMVASMLYPYTDRSEADLEKQVATMSAEERTRVMRTYAGERSNRRQRPGRALERSFYRFDVLADYGAFRDLQRHRMATIEWQPLQPGHGYVRPELVDEAGVADRFDAVMERSAELYHALVGKFPAQASYAVSLAYRLRFNINLNARSAMHVLELRSQPQGHPAYRQVVQEMHNQIRDLAGHTATAAMMTFVDHADERALERLEAERRAEQNRRVGAKNEK